MSREPEPKISKVRRGGVDIPMIQDPLLFTVRYRLRPPEHSRTLVSPTNSSRREFARRIYGIKNKQTTLYEAPTIEERDILMDDVFRQSDEIEFASHVFRIHRPNRAIDQRPRTEIILDNRIALIFKIDGKPNGAEECAEVVDKIESRYGLSRIWSSDDFEQWNPAEFPLIVIVQLTRQSKYNPIRITNELNGLDEEVDPPPLLKTAEPCLILPRDTRAEPGDALFKKQWHLKNENLYDGVKGADINATKAWDHGSGFGHPDIVVAVVDSGFDLNHKDLQRYVQPFDASLYPTKPNPNPNTFTATHGTNCAGIAIAKRGAGDVVGVAPDCSWMPIRIDMEHLGDFEELVAFLYAGLNGADVISCSWGYPGKDMTMPELTHWAIAWCALAGRNGKGIPIFFAAGNGGDSVDPDPYATHPQVMTVAASTDINTKTVYSEYGESIFICAPSSGGYKYVVTTDPLGEEGWSLDGYAIYNFGYTSAAAPMVAGVAALMLSANTSLTRTQVRNILKRTANHIDSGNTHRADKGGHSLFFGYGRVNAGDAVVAATAPTPGDSVP